MPGTTISIGALLIPAPALVLLACFFIIPWVLARIARRLNFDATWIRRVVEKGFFVGFIMARLGFVARYWEAYLESPWSIFYIWQLGYSVEIGAISSVLFIAWHIHQQRGLWRYQSVFLVGSGLLTGITIFFLVTVLMSAVSDRGRMYTGATISDFTLQDLNGNTVSWSDISGNGTIVNFWATWCPPCLREMPLLDEINQKYRPQGLNVVGISVGESNDIVRNYINSTAITYPIWVNNKMNAEDQTQKLFELYGGTAFPTTLFVDRNGVIRKRYVGELSRGYIYREIKKLLSDNL